MSIDVEFMLDLGNKVNDIHKKVHDSSDHDPDPVRKPVGGSIVIPTGFVAPVTIPIVQFPAHGRCWNILKVGIFGADTHTAVANVSCDIFAGDVLDLNSAVPNFLDCIVSASAVPFITTFGRKVEWAYSGQMIYALLNGTGLTAGQPYELIARVAEYNTADVEARHVP